MEDFGELILHYGYPQNKALERFMFTCIKMVVGRMFSLPSKVGNNQILLTWGSAVFPLLTGNS